MPKSYNVSIQAALHKDTINQDPVCNLMQFKKNRTHRQTDRQTDRRTDTQTQRAYKWLQVPSFKLMLNVGNDKLYLKLNLTSLPEIKSNLNLT